ncbi:monocarboxylate transporter [Aspergillus homomorphus CBS 101889]|uniref:Monocarboxylate transporter n=1 Tax=Aspergillus homomorphus (strain CBS 101889) TaxID=1450537 RepID=A0A395HRU6_ASPHC|nr:monocarboxylate transporter [Aspergillus homomorphus CBS 101889]RAL10219.1 monocarboxylate transporter [Aspergillus homomorphus CBS 101889]
MELSTTPQGNTCSRSGVEVTDIGKVVVARGNNGIETELEFIDNSSTNLVRRSDVNEHFPDGGLRSWLVVLGSSLLLLATYGLMNSVGVLQSYLETHQLSKYTSSNVGWVPGLYMFLSLAVGVFVGPLFDTYGPKALVIAGSAIYVVALFLTAECTQYWQFILSFGVMAGVGSALVSTVAMACVPHWFQARIGTAMGMALVGAGLGGTVFPFLLKASFARFGFRWGMRILAFVIMAACGLGSFLVKSRLPKGNKLKTAIDARCFKDSRFSLLTVAIWCLELETFALLGLFPTYVVTQGFSVDSSVNLLVVLNICSIIGRLLAGRVGDKYGRLNTLLVLVSSGILSIFIILYPFSYSLTALYFFSALYGLSSGSFLSLAPVCIRQVSPAKEIGMRFGTCYALVSFAVLISIPIGGEMFEKVGSRIVVVWLGCVLVIAMLLFLTARWACLDYKWHWRIRV